MAGKAQAGELRYAGNYSRPDCDSRAVYVQPSRDCDDYGRYSHQVFHQDLRAVRRDFRWQLRDAHRDFHQDLRRERAYGVGVPEWRIHTERCD